MQSAQHQQARVLAPSSDWRSWAAGACIPAAPAGGTAAGSFHLPDRSLPVRRALAVRSCCWACLRLPAAVWLLVQEVGMARQQLCRGLPGSRQVQPGRSLRLRRLAWTVGCRVPQELGPAVSVQQWVITCTWLSHSSVAPAGPPLPCLHSSCTLAAAAVSACHRCLRTPPGSTTGCPSPALESAAPSTVHQWAKHLDGTVLHSIWWQ